MAWPHLLHTQPKPYYSAGLVPLNTLPIGTEFLTPGGAIGVVRSDEALGGQVQVSIPSVAGTDAPITVRGELPVRPTPRALA